MAIENIVIMCLIVPFIILGVLMIYGTRKKWGYFVNLPEEASWVYPPLVFKRMFGEDFLIGFNYVFGVFWICFGTAVFIFAACGGKF